MKTTIHSLWLFATACLLVSPRSSANEAGYPPLASWVAADRVLVVPYQPAPEIDGRTGEDEWAGATTLTGPEGWHPAFAPSEGYSEFSYSVRVLHDGEALYLAFEIRDDYRLGYDGERWKPAPEADRFEEDGWPWFGDMIEILLYPDLFNLGDPLIQCAGTPSSAQLIYNFSKSQTGGVGVPGWMPHGPGLPADVRRRYVERIAEGKLRGSCRLLEEPRGYAVELRIPFEDWIQGTDGKAWSPKNGSLAIGFNLAIGDVDRPADDASGGFGLHHEDWWAGKRLSPGGPKRWGILVLAGDSFLPDW